MNEQGVDYSDVKQIDAENYQGYLVTLKDRSGKTKYGGGTVSYKICGLANFYDYAVSKGTVYNNPFKQMKRVKVPRKLPGSIPDEETLDKLFESLKDFNRHASSRNCATWYRWHVIAEVMYSTGARINEIVKLTDDDVDLIEAAVLLRDSKTGKTRIGFLNSYAVEVLRIYMGVQDYIFVEKSNKKLLFGADGSIKHNFPLAIKELSKRLGFGALTSHTIRHAFGSHMLRGGCDIRYIQEFLGHESVGTTQIYTHINKDDLRNVLDTYHPRKFREVKNEKL